MDKELNIYMVSMYPKLITGEKAQWYNEGVILLPPEPTELS